MLCDFNFLSKAMAVSFYGQKLKKNGQFWVKERFDRNHGIFTFDEVKDISCFQEKIAFEGEALHSEEDVSVNECQLLCQEDEKCNFWRYMPKSRFCDLIVTVIEELKHDDFVSGSKTCPQLGKIENYFCFKSGR